MQDGPASCSNSGIVTFAVPRDATSDNTLLPDRPVLDPRSGAREERRRVPAATRRGTGDGSGLRRPGQFVRTSRRRRCRPEPSASSTSRIPRSRASASRFRPSAGAAPNSRQAFYTRVSERLRHKDRAIDLWDYERLILEAFPQIYKVKCLNHTCYRAGRRAARPARASIASLRPGMSPSSRIPNLQMQQLRDPLKPYTSLGLLGDIEAFLKEAHELLCASCTSETRNSRRCASRFKLRLHDGFDEPTTRTR